MLQVYFSSALASNSYLHKLACWLILLLAIAIPVSTFLTNTCIYLIFLIWMVDSGAAKRWRFYFSYPLTKPILCLIALSFIGTLYSLATWEKALLTSYHLVRLAWIPMLAYYLQDEHNERKRFILPLFVCAMVFTILCTILKVHFEVPIGQRTYGNDVFKNHIVISYFMASSLFFCWVWFTENKSNRFVLFFAIVSIVFYLLFLNTGRIGFVILYSYFAIYAWYKYRLRGLLGMFIALTVVLFVAYQFSDLLAQRIGELYKDFEAFLAGDQITSLGKRLTYAKTSLEIFFSHPFFGIGTGSYFDYINSHYVLDPELRSDNPHNQYLKIGIELGVPGLLALMWLFVNQLKATHSLKGVDFILARGVFITFIFGCLFNSWFKNFSEVYFYCLMSAYFVPYLYLKKGAI